MKKNLTHKSHITTLLILLSLIILIANTTNEGFAKTKNLPFPEKNKAYNSIEYAISGFHIGKERILALANDKKQVIHIPFKLKKDDYPFGKLLDSKRHLIKTSFPSPYWVSIFSIKNKLFMLDGKFLNMIVLDTETLQPIAESTISWDLVIPARDRAGEASIPEKNSVNREFTKQFRKNKNVRISAISPIPQHWIKDKGINFLAATQIQKHPLVTINCKDDVIPACSIKRVCNVHGLDIKSEDIRGIGVHKDTRLVLIADQKTQEIKTLKFQSCFNVRAHNLKWKLPNKLKAISNLTVDSESRLWVSTEATDDYWNASLFYWEPTDWLDP